MGKRENGGRPEDAATMQERDEGRLHGGNRDGEEQMESSHLGGIDSLFRSA